MEDEMRQIRQTARELQHEATEEEFLDEFGLGDTCSRCGRTGLDDEDYTDCDLDEHDDLVCHDCLGKR